MLRITETRLPPLTTITLEGKLLQPWVQAVSEAVEGARAAGRVRCNLSALSFADRDGIETLRALAAEGVELIEPSPFIESLMSQVPTRD